MRVLGSSSRVIRQPWPMLNECVLIKSKLGRAATLSNGAHHNSIQSIKRLRNSKRTTTISLLDSVNIFTD